MNERNLFFNWNVDTKIWRKNPLENKPRAWPLWALLTVTTQKLLLWENIRKALQSNHNKHIYQQNNKIAVITNVWVEDTAKIFELIAVYITNVYFKWFSIRKIIQVFGREIHDKSDPQMAWIPQSWPGKGKMLEYILLQTPSTKQAAIYQGSCALVINC